MTASLIRKVLIILDMMKLEPQIRRGSRIFSRGGGRREEGWETFFGKLFLLIHIVKLHTHTFQPDTSLSLSLSLSLSYSLSLSLLISFFHFWNIQLQSGGGVQPLQPPLVCLFISVNIFRFLEYITTKRRVNIYNICTIINTVKYYVQNAPWHKLQKLKNN